jgi:hypothetical protein
MTTLDLAHCQATIAQSGWDVVDNVHSEAEAQAILGSLGSFLEQLGGQKRYEVRAEAAAAHLSSSKSSNAIPPHTEASSLLVPPAFVGLLCFQQSSCGGGQTQLGDGLALMACLSAEQQWLAQHRPGQLLIFDNFRLLHARTSYEEPERLLIRYWLGEVSSLPVA